MKFDHLLKIYWSRYFLYGGVTFPFSMTLYHLARTLRGFGPAVLSKLEKRAERGPLHGWWRESLLAPMFTTKRLTLNIFFGKLLNINGGVREWEYQNQMRFYLIKSYRGRALAMGKPARGQRTWSNARNARKSTGLFKSFVTTMHEERRKRLALEAARFAFWRSRGRIVKRQIKRRSNRQKKLQIHINAESLWF